MKKQRGRIQYVTLCVCFAISVNPVSVFSTETSFNWKNNIVWALLGQAPVTAYAILGKETSEEVPCDKTALFPKIESFLLPFFVKDVYLRTTSDGVDGYCLLLEAPTVDGNSEQWWLFAKPDTLKGYFAPTLPETCYSEQNKSCNEALYYLSLLSLKIRQVRDFYRETYDNFIENPDYGRTKKFKQELKRYAKHVDSAVFITTNLLPHIQEVFKTTDEETKTTLLLPLIKSFDIFFLDLEQRLTSPVMVTTVYGLPDEVETYEAMTKHFYWRNAKEFTFINDKLTNARALEADDFELKKLQEDLSNIYDQALQDYSDYMDKFQDEFMKNWRDAMNDIEREVNRWLNKYQY